MLLANKQQIYLLQNLKLNLSKIKLTILAIILTLEAAMPMNMRRPLRRRIGAEHNSQKTYLVIISIKLCRYLKQDIT